VAVPGIDGGNVMDATNTTTASLVTEKPFVAVLVVPNHELSARLAVLEERNRLASYNEARGCNAHQFWNGSVMFGLTAFVG